MLYSPLLIFIAIFVYLAASSEAHMVALRAASRGVPVSHAMIATMPAVGHRTTLEQAFRSLQQKQAAAVGVIDRRGKLIGLVTGETIAEMMMLQNSLPKGVNFGPWTRPPSSKAA